MLPETSPQTLGVFALAEAFELLSGFLFRHIARTHCRFNVGRGVSGSDSTHNQVHFRRSLSSPESSGLVLGDPSGLDHRVELLDDPVLVHSSRPFR